MKLKFFDEKVSLTKEAIKKLKDISDNIQDIILF